MKLISAVLFFCFFANFTALGQIIPELNHLTFREIDSLATYYTQHNKLQEVLQVEQAAQKRASNNYAQEDSIYIHYTYHLGLTHSNLGHYSKALPLFQTAYTLNLQSFGQRHVQTIQIGHQLANLYDRLGDYTKALSLYVDVSKNMETLFGSNAPELSDLYNNFAGLHKRMGNYPEALELYLKAMNIHKAPTSENPISSSVLNNLAHLHALMGRYELALPLFIQAKDITKETYGSKDPNFATALNNLAVLYKRMGNHHLALPLLNQAKDIYSQSLGKSHPSYANTLVNLAWLHEKMQHTRLAPPLYKKAIEIYEQKLGLQHPKVATSLNYLANAYQRLGQYEQALPLHLRAKNIEKAVLGTNHPAFATSLNSLSAVYRQMGQLDLAQDYLIQSINIKKEILGERHPKYILSLNSLVSLHLKMNQPELAWQRTQELIKACSNYNLSRQIGNAWADSLLQAAYPSNTHVVHLVSTLDLVYRLVQDQVYASSKEQKSCITNLALGLLEKLRHQLSNEQDQLRILAQQNAWILKKLFLLSPQTDSKEAFKFADQNKSVLLSQFNSSEKFYQRSKLPDALIWKDKKLVKTRDALQAQLLEKRTNVEKDSLRNSLNITNQEMERFIAKIKKDFPLYAQSRYQQSSLSVDKIQQSLNKKSLLIEYVLSKNQIHIFALSQDSCLWIRQDLNSEKLQQNIKSFHTVLSDYNLLAKDIETSFDQYSSLGYWFYQQLLEPVLDQFQDKTQLIFVTDGTLGHLPFETFLMQAAPQDLKKQVADFGQLDYLLNKYSISYNYSASLWQKNKTSKPKQNNGNMLAMASNYNIALDSNLSSFRLPTEQWLRGKLAPLPAANEEVKVLEKSFSGYFAYNKEASERNIKSKASEYAIIHLAMHGILDHKRPVLSSLAFTENSDSSENNFWQAHEISQTTLHADLVVLSACETGYGKFEHGNGIASLARAFMYAGAASLIVSLWQVNDHATAEIMKNIYSNLAQGVRKDEALRLAKLDYIKTARGLACHPAFWSPFIQIGNSSPMYIAQQSNVNWFYVFSVLGIILILSYLLFKQKFFTKNMGD